MMKFMPTKEHVDEMFDKIRNDLFFNPCVLAMVQVETKQIFHKSCTRARDMETLTRQTMAMI